MLKRLFGASQEAMLSTLTMTIIGPDRPGIVQLVADRIAAHNGNWLESRMCRLGGQFTGIVQASVPASQAAALERALAALDEQDLRVVVHTEEKEHQPKSSGLLVKLEIVGHDRPGIVKQITGVLTAYGVNVEAFSSECVNAPMDGTQLFQANASILVPSSVQVSTVRAELERIAADLMVDIHLVQTAN